MKFPAKIVFVPLLAVMAGCALLGKGSDTPARGKVVNIGGEEAMVRSFILPAMETFEEETGVSLHVVPGPPGKELIDLERHGVDVVISELPMKELLKHAAQEKVVIDPVSLQQAKVGKNSTVVMLHKKNRVAKLSKKQLKGIFTGKIKNWRTIGGPNREVVVVWDPSATAEKETFIRDMLDGAQVTAKTLTVKGLDELRARIMDTPGAIGIAPNGFVAPGVRVPRTPVVTSQVIMVTKGEPTPNVKKLMDLLLDVEFIQ